MILRNSDRLMQNMTRLNRSQNGHGKVGPGLETNRLVQYSER